MAKLKGSQALFQSLRAQGVDTIFGLIGAHTMELFDAMFDHQDAIRFISTRHEHAAALAADGYGRATGRPGVLLSSTGPGAANSMGGMGEAFFSFSPVLNISSTDAEHLYGRGLGANHEVKDQLGMFRTMTQWSAHVSRPDQIPDLVFEAFKCFQTRRPQPIAIEIPADVQAQEAEVEIPQVHTFPRPAGDPDKVEQAARLLLSGKRVAIWAGTGVDRADGHAELVQLATTLGIPVFTTPGGKCAIPTDHPMWVGVLGGPGGLPSTEENPLIAFLNSLDTLLVVGSSLRYTSTKVRNLKLPANLIHVDISDEPMGKNYEPAVGVVGDAKVVLAQLTEAVRDKPAQLQPGFDKEIPQLKRAFQEYGHRVAPNAARLMEAVRGAVARDAIFTGDPCIAATRGLNPFLPVYSPRSYLPPMWGGLGAAFPSAMGARAGLPRRQVICVTGDGGFQFNIQELGTCVQYGLNVVVLLFNDNAWGSTRERQTRSYQGRYLGTDLKNPDFVRLAEAYGAAAWRATSVKELVPALEQAVQADTVSVIEVVTPNGFDNFV